MFRGNWRKLSALIIGLIALGGLSVAYELYDASEQHQSDYQYQPAAKSHISAPIVGKSPAKAYEPSCQNPQGNSDADLCAQWAAVEQVVESNRLSSLNARLAVFVAFLSTLGTGLLIWTFKETRDTSRRELRAYLFPENVGCFEIIETKKNKLGRESKHKTGIVPKKPLC